MKSKNLLRIVIIALFTCFLTHTFKAQTPHIVKDIVEGSESSFTFSGAILFSFENTILFNIEPQDGSIQLWISDGTDKGTQMLYEIDYWLANFSRFYKTNDGHIYFVSELSYNRSQLNVLDISTNEVDTLLDLPDFSAIEYYNDAIYLNISNSILKKYDIKTKEVTQVHDFERYNLGKIKIYNNYLYCFITENTQAYICKIDIKSNEIISKIKFRDEKVNVKQTEHQFISVDNTFYFLFENQDFVTVDNDTLYCYNIDKQDNIDLCAQYLYPAKIKSWNNKLVIRAKDAPGYENNNKLFIVNSKPNSTIKLETEENITDFTIAQESIYFISLKTFYGCHIYVTDGTVENTQIAIDAKYLAEDTTSYIADYFKSDQIAFCNGKIIFNGNLYYGEELWLSNGTSTESFEFDLYKGQTGSRPSNIYATEDKIYFSATTEEFGEELMVIDIPEKFPPILREKKFEVYYSSEKDEIIGNVNAISLENKEFTLSIVGGNVDKTFKIDETTGNIMLNNSNNIYISSNAITKLAIQAKENEPSGAVSVDTVVIEIYNWLNYYQLKQDTFYINQNMVMNDVVGEISIPNELKDIEPEIDFPSFENTSLFYMKDSSIYLKTSIDELDADNYKLIIRFYQRDGSYMTAIGQSIIYVQNKETESPISTAIHKHEVQNMLYPNPTSGLVMINEQLNPGTKIEVINATGQHILTKTLDELNYSIDLSGLAGIFMVKTTNGGNVTIQKVIVK